MEKENIFNDFLNILNDENIKNQEIISTIYMIFYCSLEYLHNYFIKEKEEVFTPLKFFCFSMGTMLPLTITVCLFGTAAETPVKSEPLNAFFRAWALIMSLPPPMFAAMPSSDCAKYAPISAEKSVFTLPSFCALKERSAEQEANPNNTNRYANI